ncbi:MAG TPA: Dabb family protein [Candidatus Dormibacteraeota bacterium]|nr:Dabb family protein [Candidatus Dormibacteraeota bacterium]
MLRHVALFRWKPETTAEDVSKVEAALHQLPAKIPCIQSYRYGRDLGVQSGNADFALVADFSDQEGLQTYANHPDHQAVIQNLIRPILAQREAIQYVIDHSD